MALTNGQIAVAEVPARARRAIRSAPTGGAARRSGRRSTSATSPCAAARRQHENGVDRAAALDSSRRCSTAASMSNARVKEFPPARRYLLPLGSLEWVDFTGQTRVHPRGAVGDVPVMRLLLSQGRRPEDRDVQRHDGADGRGGRELGGRRDVQRIAGDVDSGRAALSGSGARRERRQRDGAAGGARRGQSRLRRHHRAARDARRAARSSRTRKGARRTCGRRASFSPRTRRSRSRRRWRCSIG